MGRRYQQPADRRRHPDRHDRCRCPIGGAGNVAPIMAAADASTVNLETVVGQLPAIGCVSGKALPAAVAAGCPRRVARHGHRPRDASATTTLTTGRSPGVASTIASLDGAGIAWAGAGTTAEQAQAGRIIDVGGTKVGVVSATTVNGDFVNDNLPGCRRGQAGRRSTTRLVAVRGTQHGRVRKAGRPGVRRPPNRAAPGVAWTAVRASSSRCSTPIRQGALWTSMAKVYPELQDWVGRGVATVALPRSRSAVRSTQSIKDLRQHGRRSRDRRDPRRLPVLRRRQ